MSEETFEHNEDTQPTPEPEQASEPEATEPASAAAGATEEEAARDEFIQALSQEEIAAPGAAPRRGDIVKGVVAAFTNDAVLVDIGGKTEGKIPLAEIDEELQVGQEIDVYVASKPDEDGVVTLSKKRADFEKLWDKIVEAKKTGEILQAMVVDRVKGGLRVDLGVIGFVPGSQIAAKPSQFDKFVGKELRLRVLEVDRKNRKVILSHKSVVDEERKRQREELWEKLEAGSVVEGRVRSLTSYGAFVDLGGVSGLLHISDMAWIRLEHPSEAVKVGDHIKVMVLEVDRERERISLGLKQILPDPWKEVGRKYKERQVIQVKVARLVASGAFVKLPEGVEAFLPIGEMSEKRLSKPEEALEVGQELDVMILKLHPAARRMTVSLQRAKEAKEKREYRDFLKQQDSGPVTLGEVFGEALAAAANGDSASEPASDEANSSQPEEAPEDESAADAEQSDD